MSKKIGKESRCFVPCVKTPQTFPLRQKKRRIERVNVGSGKKEKKARKPVMFGVVAGKKILAGIPQRLLGRKLFREGWGPQGILYREEGF